MFVDGTEYLTEFDRALIFEVGGLDVIFRSFAGNIGGSTIGSVDSIWDGDVRGGLTLIFFLLEDVLMERDFNERWCGGI